MTRLPAIPGQLVLQGDVSEQVTHRLSVVYATNGLSQQWADVDGLDLLAAVYLRLVSHCVGHHKLLTVITERHGNLFS